MLKRPVDCLLPCIFSTEKETMKVFIKKRHLVFLLNDKDVGLRRYYWDTRVSTA